MLLPVSIFSLLGLLKFIPEIFHYWSFFLFFSEQTCWYTHTEPPSFWRPEAPCREDADSDAHPIWGFTRSRGEDVAPGLHHIWGQIRHYLYISEVSALWAQLLWGFLCFQHQYISMDTSLHLPIWILGHFNNPSPRVQHSFSLQAITIWTFWFIIV